MKWELYNDDISEEEDFMLVVEELFIKENELKYMKIDEVSWVKI